MIKIEEDIKRCRELIKPEHSNWIGITNQTAIEHLIKGYRELEIENQSYRDYMGELPCYDNASYIKKSKIKEKIEELKLPNIIVGGRRNYKVLEYGKKLGKLEILQELLEEG